jgi:beta-lactamase superfamily II metal-dependent hydrolase
VNATARVDGTLQLSVEMLPARKGDSILVEWPFGQLQIRMLVDAGPAPAYELVSGRLNGIEDRRIDFVVMTHVDADHVEGVIRLINDRDLALSIGDVWFNAARHIRRYLAPRHGEMLSALITKLEIPWNETFGQAAVRAPATGAFDVYELPGDVCATVLAPDQAALRALLVVWQEACEQAGIAMGSTSDGLEELEHRPALQPKKRYLKQAMLDVDALARARSGKDTSVTNASSIVVLLEPKEGPGVLLAGDSTPAVLVPAVRRLLEERGIAQLQLDVFKLPHHGSQKNITAELVRMLPARRYLVSSDGSPRSNHPDDEAIATIVKYGPPGLELVFNYDTQRNRRWADGRLTRKHHHRVSFEPGVTIDEAVGAM